MNSWNQKALKLERNIRFLKHRVFPEGLLDDALAALLGSTHIVPCALLAGIGARCTSRVLSPADELEVLDDHRHLAAAAEIRADLGLALVEQVVVISLS